MARLTSQRLRRSQLPLRLNLAKAQALPFPTHHFANIVATFPTDYMLAPDTMAEVYRILQPANETRSSGRLVVVFEGHLRGPWPIRPLINWLYEITDQRSLSPAKPLHQLNTGGFTARWELVERDGAVARLLIAEKQG
jgi:ubiquinone/menaquinone biosynthesis C-methylase UbiE